MNTRTSMFLYLIPLKLLAQLSSSRYLRTGQVLWLEYDEDSRPQDHHVHIVLNYTCCSFFLSFGGREAGVGGGLAV